MQSLKRIWVKPEPLPMRVNILFYLVFAWGGAALATPPPPDCVADNLPVCGQPPMPKCPPDTLCAQVMPQLQTYASICVMKKSGATWVANGKCPLPTKK